MKAGPNTAAVAATAAMLCGVGEGGSKNEAIDGIAGGVGMAIRGCCAIGGVIGVASFWLRWRSIERNVRPARSIQGWRSERKWSDWAISSIFWRKSSARNKRTSTPMPKARRMAFER